MAERLPTCVQRAMVILVALLMAMCMFATTAYADDGGGADDGIVEYITVGDDTQPFKLLRSIVNAELNGLNSTSRFIAGLLQYHLWCWNGHDDCVLFDLSAKRIGRRTMDNGCACASVRNACGSMLDYG